MWKKGDIPPTNEEAIFLTRNDKGIVTDLRTGLEWQDNYLDNSIEKDDYFDAITYCNSLELGNNNDWRLPTRNEFLTIINNEKQPTIDYTTLNALQFSYVLSSLYWTSDLSSKVDKSWAVDFSNARIKDYDSAGFHFAIRCVRGLSK